MKIQLIEKKWIQFLCNKYESEGRPHIVKLLKYAHLEKHSFGLGVYSDKIILWVRHKELGDLSAYWAYSVIEAVKAIARLHNCGDARFAVYSPDEEPYGPRVEMEEVRLGLNNCFFKTDETIEHDELRFRSKAEVAIYDELKKRKLVFFPNPAAVLGVVGNKKEPDFLICHKGKWGILEVMGKGWHNETTAVKDHERARLFKEHGIMCMEFYSGMACMSNPSGVVDSFLALLAKH